MLNKFDFSNIIVHKYTGAHKASNASFSKHDASKRQAAALEPVSLFPIELFCVSLKQHSLAKRDSVYIFFFL